MPTYQYRCTECSQDLEVFQKFSDASLQECPSCAGRLRKVFSAVGVVFKGPGFYSTDRNSRTAGRPASADANAPAPAAGESGPSSSETSRVSMTSGSKSDTSAPSAPKAAASSTGSTTST